MLLRAQQNTQVQQIDPQADEIAGNYRPPVGNAIQADEQFILRTNGELEFSIRPSEYPREVINMRNAAKFESGVAIVLERTILIYNLTTLRNKIGIIFVSAENAEADDRVALYVASINWTILLHVAAGLCQLG